jgi:hypothetical protein
VLTSLIDALCFSVKKHVTARSKSLAYIRPHLRSLETFGVREKSLALRRSSQKKFSKPLKSILITFLGLAQAL